MSDELPPIGRALRHGYTTGACAAAAAVGAWLGLRDGKTPEAVEILFPDGAIHSFPLESVAGRCVVVKDAGDDPDITHKAKIWAETCPFRIDDATPEDYVVEIGRGSLVLRAGRGVGFCTRGGLDCAKGKWAINPTPRAMIADNLTRNGFGTEAGCLLAVIGIENGEELASHTLNPQLGIQGGLSILGTSGRVRPYSNKAYLDTIRVFVRSLSESGGRRVAFATGARSMASIRRILDDLPETAFLTVGDFVEDSLRLAANAGIGEVTFACMVGKLIKYAAGQGNTHAHTIHQDLTPLLDAACSIGVAAPILNAMAACVTAREALDLLSSEEAKAALDKVALKALSHLEAWGSPMRVRLFVFDSGPNPLVDLQRQRT